MWIMTALLDSFQFGCFPFISSSYLNPVARTSNYCAVWKWWKQTVCLVPDLREILSVFAHWVWCWLSVCHIQPLLCWSMTPLFLLCWEFFNIYGFWILSNAFSASIDMIMWFLSFLLFVQYITFIDLWVLYQSCIPGINPTWSWYMIFLMFCWIQFANILLRILPSMFIRDIGI